MKQLFVFPRKLRTYLFLIPILLPLHMTVELIYFGPFWTTSYKVMLSQKLILNHFFLHRESCALSPIEDIKQFLGLQRSSLFTNQFGANQEFIKAYIVSFLVREREAKEKWWAGHKALLQKSVFTPVKFHPGTEPSKCIFGLYILLTLHSSAFYCLQDSNLLFFSFK